MRLMEPRTRRATDWRWARRVTRSFASLFEGNGAPKARGRLALGRRREDEQSCGKYGEQEARHRIRTGNALLSERIQSRIATINVRDFAVAWRQSCSADGAERIGTTTPSRWSAACTSSRAL